MALVPTRSAPVPTVQQMLEKLHSVTDWYILGIHMRVETSQLDKIRIQFHVHGVDRCKAELFKYWLKNVSRPSWSKVISALEKTGEIALGDALREELLSSCSAINALSPTSPAAATESIIEQCDEGEPLAVLEKPVVKKFTKLEAKFSKLVADVKLNLEENATSLKQVQRLLSERLEEVNLFMADPVDFDELFQVIRPFYCFLQYNLLEGIIDEFLGNRLQPDLDAYEAELEQFKSSTKIRELANVVTRHLKSTEGTKPVVIKLAGCWLDVTLRHFLNFLKQVFLKKSSHLANISVTDGCICIDWLAPVSIISSLITLVQPRVEFLKAAGVLLLKFGSETILKEDELQPDGYLLRAVQSSNEEAVELLIGLMQFSSDSNVQASMDSALFISCQQGSKRIAEMLLKAGANANYNLSRDIPKPLMLASIIGNQALVELLLSYKADVNATTDEYSSTPLMLAAINNRANIVRYLILECDNLIIDYQDNNGFTALMFACLRQNGEIVEELLQAGASPFLRDNGGSNALMHSCRLVSSPNPTLPEVFLALGVDPNDKDQEGRSALSIASATNHISAVDSLLTAKASLNMCDRQQWNALCYAADAGNAEIVEHLLLAGSHGFLGIAHDLAQKNGHTKVCQLLFIAMTASVRQGAQ